MPRISWEEYALEIARTVRLRSEDPWTQVGACILREDNTVASVGYNGAPAGIDIDWSNREMRLAYVIHAEINALRYVRPGEGRIIAVTLLPCSACLTAIAAQKIKKIVYGEVYHRDPRALEVAGKLGLDLYQVDLKDKQ